MNRRDILKSFSILPFGFVCAKSAETKEFKPDYILKPDDRLSQYVVAYLNGQRVRYCFEAHVTWESFDRPAHGVLIVASLRSMNKPLRAMLHESQEGECELNGVLVQRATGLVRIDLAPEGRKYYQLLRDNMQREEDNSNRRQQILGRK